MGIRVHTVLGYGWEKFDFKTLPKDDEGDYLPKMAEVATKENINDSKQFLSRINNTGWYEKDKKITVLNVWDFVKYDAFSLEKDEPAALVITSPLNEDWSRYDDIIDYYSGDKQENKVKLLNLDCGAPKPIYPHDGFVNKNTGERLTGWNYSDMWDGEKSFKAKTGIGFGDLAAIVPYEIALFCKVAKFPSDNPLDIYTAKPMIYTYWC